MSSEPFIAFLVGIPLGLGISSFILGISWAGWFFIGIASLLVGIWTYLIKKYKEEK